jgi:hypothetical protein
MKTLLFILVLTFWSLLTPSISSAEIAGASANLLVLEVKEKDDSRTHMLEAYLTRYNSPLSGHAAIFVKEADKNQLDYRLLVAIAGVESTFGKRIPTNSYNGWGWGIYGDNTHGFASWTDAIETISRELRTKYMDKWGAKTVHDIGSYYASDPNWANKVTHFLNDFDQFEQSEKNKTLSISI